MKSLFSEATLTQIEERINSVTDESKRQWGSMSPAQMLWHCKAPLRLALNNTESKRKVNPLKKIIYRLFKSSMYNDKPWKQNLPAPKAFVASETYDLEQEKKNLLGLVKQFHDRKDQEEWKPHPIFGKFTKEQWGQMQYKHLDHHLRQFGV
jgi:hypothetical protein